MPSILRPRPVLSLLALLGVALVALALASASNASGAGHGPKPRSHPSGEPLVIRGDATVADATCDAGVCPIELTGGTLRGAPLGAATYTGSLRLRVTDTFPNGEGGVCAPIDGRLVLGAGSPDRLVLAVDGTSCQDGSGPPPASSFTGLARFRVLYGTGTYAGATGRGLATFLEDAQDHDRMTLIGRIAT